MEGPPAASAGVLADELAAVTRAMVALEGQRATLGDAVVETALQPLRRRRAELEAPRSEERRLVSVLFADLVDFTVLSRRLDPEDVREIVNHCFAEWQQAIAAQGGVVEKFIGDAVMAVFGLRRSFEDDAQRAVRAAVAMTAAVPALSAHVEARHGIALHMRAGVDTGEVVVSTLGDRADGDFVAVGQTVNRASRLQAAAPVDRVLISVDTHRQIRGRFAFEEQEPLSLKGIDAPVEVYVVGEERPQGFGVDRAGGVEGVESRTVGRELQLGFLRARLADVATERRWRVLTVVGDAGIGKSRLLQDFDTELMEGAERVWWFRGRASPSARDRSQGLLRDVMATRLGVRLTDPAEDVRARLRSEMERVLDPATADRDADVVGSWLGFELGPDLDVPADPQARRDLGTEVLARYFAALAATAPVVVLLEDLHWADDGSLRWLDAADALLSDSAVLVVATTRPTLLEERPHWGEGLEHHVRLPLTALSRREGRELALHLLGQVPDPPAALVDLLVEAADGNPFYAEELVNWLIDAGVVVRADPHWLVVEELVGSVVVPDTLKGVLQSRLDTLGPRERTVLQRASVVGRVFWDSLLGFLAPDHEPQPATELDVLRRREIVFERGTAVFEDAREFLFKHALLRDVAYESVLRAHRERYHLRIADWLAEASASAGRSDEYAAAVAEHFALGRSPRAAAYFLQAGRRAGAVYANEEATRLLGQAADLAERTDRALCFDVHAAQEDLYDRLGDREAQSEALAAMSESLDPDDETRNVLLLLARSRWTFNHSEYPESVALASEASGRATALGRADLHAEGELWAGKAHTWADQVELARTRLRAAIEAAEAAGVAQVPGEAYRYLSMVASDTGGYAEALELAETSRSRFADDRDTEGESMALAMAGTIYFHLGRVDDARRAFEQVLPIFRRAGHRYRIAGTVSNLASVNHRQGRLAEAETWAREAVEAGRDLDDREAVATNLVVLSVVESTLGRHRSAAEHLTSSVAIARSVPARAIEAEALARLTYARLGLGDVAGAMESAEQSRAAATEALSGIDSGNAGLALGYAAVEAGEWDAAEEAFTVAATDFAAVEVRDLERECLIGLAGVQARRGRLADAARIVREALPHLDSTMLVGVSASRMLKTCVDVLRAVDDPAAEEVRARALSYLHERAALAGSDDLAAEFLAEPTNARLLG